jgi:pyrroline-5-carboxylate reductase
MAAGPGGSLPTLGVIGTGGALLALGGGRSASSEPLQLIVLDPVSANSIELVESPGVSVVTSVDELVDRSDVILVSAEPEDAVAALETLASCLGKEGVVVVSTAGVTLELLRGALGPGPALLRVALGPAVPAPGLVVLCPEPGTSEEALERAARLLGRLGVVETITEDHLEAAGAVAGASVGFLALALEGLEDGAVNAGLPRDVARVFVRQTLLATALLLGAQAGSPADLKDQVASPGGTTIAGLAVLEDRGVRGAFLRAAEAAVTRAYEEQDARPSHVLE